MAGVTALRAFPSHGSGKSEFLKVCCSIRGSKLGDLGGVAGANNLSTVAIQTTSLWYGR